MNGLKLNRFVDKVESDLSFDVVVIGGGITGATLAYESASRGLSVGLFEKQDFGGATSAATGKLIHGGLRYLKQFEIGLVREALKERRILSNIAPNLVYPYPMILPKPGLVARIGLFVYDLLSFDSKWTWDKTKQIPNHKYLNREQIRKRGLGDFEDGVYFYDNICLSPERLTLHFLKSAFVHGAKISNYTKVESLLWEGKRVVGVTIRNLLDDKVTNIRSKVVINASGPWTHDVLNTSPNTSLPIPKKRSEGIYLITKKLTDVMTLFVGDKGHFSFAPWRGHSMIGPTEKSYFGKVKDWVLTKESVEEFLDYINGSGLLKEKLLIEDVKFVYGGLRPLVESDSEDTYSSSRKSDLHDHTKDGIEGLITAAGGKYTTSRSFAEEIFKHIKKKIGKKTKPNISKSSYLYASNIENIENFIQTAKNTYKDFSANTIDYLIRHYGLDYEVILEIARTAPNLATVLDGDGEILAQVYFAIHYEMAKSLTDIFFRRTGLGTLGKLPDEILDTIIQFVKKELLWDDRRTQSEVDILLTKLNLPS
ncbi:glycerol-3-phosphate dehydrogenase/oxidase [Leptospira sp. 96542]|nr:glycerol-3-phosphate dehydrogenase/oxidase [Leptospira sp. 96542]